jgi:hypothetical protein
MNKLLNLGVLVAFGLTASASVLAQATEEADAATVTRNVRVLSPEVSRSLKLARTPTAPTPLIVGTYWSCKQHSSGFDICRIKLVVCTDGQQYCVEI